MANFRSRKQFSGFFFINLFLSLIFSLMIFFLFIRLKTTENSFNDYFSKVLTNFQINFEQSVYNDSIQNWFNPNLKSDEQEKFQKYKLSILAKTINTFFKNILIETQNYIITKDLQNFILNKSQSSIKKVKLAIKQHILNNPDLKEFSIYDTKGNKVFGIKYKHVPDYLFSKKVIDELSVSKNLLLKRGDDSNLFLLSIIQNSNQKPFLIISQSIDKKFFNRILRHLEIDKDVFYIKDSKNFVLFDNQNLVDNQDNSQVSYRIFKALTQPEEKTLKINLNNISYSLGTITQKNNTWGNLTSVGFLSIIFLLSFFCIDFLVAQVKKLRFWNQEDLLESPPSVNSEMQPALQESSVEDEAYKNPPEHETSSKNISSIFNKSYEEVKPLTLEQYLLKEKKSLRQNDRLD